MARGGTRSNALWLYISISPDSSHNGYARVPPRATAGLRLLSEKRLAIKDAYQTAGITQAQAAEMLGLSRPHLANALTGRYPLSEAKVEKRHEFLAQPPPVVAPRLL